MTVTKVFCDHCGKELNPMEDYCDLTLDFNVRPYIDVDLCDNCLEELYRTFVRFCSKAP